MSEQKLVQQDFGGSFPIYYNAKGEWGGDPRKLQGDARPKVDPDFLYDFFLYRTEVPPHSLYEGVKSLFCGEELWRVGSALELRNPAYRSLAALSAEDRPIEDFIDELDELFKSYIKRVTQGPEPLAITLSGGVDSSLLATYVPKDTICVTWGGWGEKGTDIDYSRMVSDKLGLKRHIVVPYEVSQDEELYRAALRRSPTPFMYTLGVSFLRMARTLESELAPSYKLLIGQNADTISGAYKTTIATHFLSRLALLTQYIPVPESALWRYRKLSMLTSPNPFVGFAFHHSTSLYPSPWLRVPKSYFADRLSDLERETGRSYGRFNDAIIAELIQIESRRAQFAGHVLASYHGAKTLAPFYDEEIVRLMMTVPFSIRRKGGFAKPILRALALRRGVPEEVVKLKSKKGLSYNYKTFMREGRHIPIWDEIERDPIIAAHLDVRGVRAREERNYFTMDMLRSLHEYFKTHELI